MLRFAIDDLCNKFGFDHVYVVGLTASVTPGAYLGRADVIETLCSPGGFQQGSHAWNARPGLAGVDRQPNRTGTQVNSFGVGDFCEPQRVGRCSFVAKLFCRI